MKNTVWGYWTYLIQTETKVGERLNEIQNDRFGIEDITCSHPKDGNCLEYELTLVFNDSEIKYRNDSYVIEDLRKVVTILKEELYNKEFNIFLRNKDGTSYSLWLSSETIKKSNNIEELIK
ncbi:hypothetical protein BWGOE9_57870 [Bacillus mycoides]|nr:hypothetical protein BWGOE9_57870 [Bacillus mycoides]